MDPLSAAPRSGPRSSGYRTARKDQGQFDVPRVARPGQVAVHDLRKNHSWTAYVTQSRTQRLTAEKGVTEYREEQSQLHGTLLGQFEPAHPM